MIKGWVPRHYSWQDGPCKNYNSKVASVQQNEFMLGQLPITLTGAIAHGHGDERYAQYCNELWPNNPKFTIGSLQWLLQTLEVALVLEWNYCLNTPCRIHSLHVCCKGIVLHTWITHLISNCWCETFAKKFVASNG